jgi:NADH pyrophosphatase NudC (nudix superfamily)
LARVGISAHIARLRAAVGHDLLLVPSVTVLPFDEAGRVLLVRHIGHHDGWGVVGGAIEIGESPAQAAVREAGEEIGAELAGGVLRPDGSEISGLAWFTREELAGLARSRFARAVLLATHVLSQWR